MDPLTIALSLLQLVARVTPLIDKLRRGDDLTPAERVEIDALVAAETARAEALDEEARRRLENEGGQIGGGA